MYRINEVIYNNKTITTLLKSIKSNSYKSLLVYVIGSDYLEEIKIKIKIKMLFFLYTRLLIKKIMRDKPRILMIISLFLKSIFCYITFFVDIIKVFLKENNRHIQLL